MKTHVVKRIFHSPMSSAPHLIMNVGGKPADMNALVASVGFSSRV